MHSCEYLKVSGKHKTKLTCIRNIRFFLGKHQLLHSDKLLHLADSVSITFEQQKHDSKNDVITQHRSRDKLLCPVKIWCKIIQFLLSYSSSNQDTTVNTFILPNGKPHHFTGSEVLKGLCIAVEAIGSDTLGFTADQIGLLHLARSGAEMAMYLAGIPVFTIMLLERWPSDTFLRYIRKQVKEFSSGVSQKMITHEDFFTIPLSTSKNIEGSNHSLNLPYGNENGICLKEAIRPLIKAFS
jgi:hypothetical protein